MLISLYAFALVHSSVEGTLFQCSNVHMALLLYNEAILTLGKRALAAKIGDGDRAPRMTSEKFVQLRSFYPWNSCT